MASATPTSGAAPLAVSFSGAGSSDPDGSIVSYAWTFADGATGSGACVSHTYAAAGTYTATLTVKDDGGPTATSRVTGSTDTKGVANLFSRKPEDATLSPRVVGLAPPGKIGTASEMLVPLFEVRS